MAIDGAEAVIGPVVVATLVMPYLVPSSIVQQIRADDYSRSYRGKVDETGKPRQGEVARPIQTLIWYPAQQSAAGHLTYGDYLNLAAETPQVVSASYSWVARYVLEFVNAYLNMMRRQLVS